MRRAQTILIAMVLLAAPLSPLAAASCCTQPSCCAKGYCSLPTKRAQQKSNGKERFCHRSSSQDNNCAMKSACNRTSEAGVTSSIPQAVLHAAIELRAPDAVRRSVVSLPLVLSAGFDPIPFEPPRS